MKIGKGIKKQIRRHRRLRWSHEKISKFYSVKIEDVKKICKKVDEQYYWKFPKEIEEVK